MLDISLLSTEHLSEVAVLETLCFSEPWSEKSLAFLLTENNFGMVAIEDGRVLAYGGMTCVLDEGAVTNIATHPDFRSRGIGKALLRRMLDEAKARNIKTIFLEVRESNLVAQRLYSREGFAVCGKRKGFYKNPTEDALQMIYTTE